MAIADKERSQRALFNDELFSVFLDKCYQGLVKKLETSNNETYVDTYISELKEIYDFIPEIDPSNIKLKEAHERNKICVVISIKYKGNELYFEKIPKDLTELILGYIDDNKNELIKSITYDVNIGGLPTPEQIDIDICGYVNKIVEVLNMLKSELADFIVKKEEELIKRTQDHNDQVRVIDELKQIRLNIDKNKDSDFILVPTDKDALKELKKKIKSQVVKGKG